MIVGDGGVRRDAHAGALVVGVDADAHEVELPAELGLLLDEGVEVVPAIFGRGVLLAVGVEADHHLGVG